MTLTNPTNIGILGKNAGVFLRNHGGTDEIWVDRVQEANGDVTINSQDAYELGNASKVGVAQEPAEFRFMVRGNLYGSEIDHILANASGSSVASLTLGDMIANSAVRACIVVRDQAGTNPSYEFLYDNNALAELNYAFEIGGACTSGFTLEGKLGKVYTSGSLIHATWGTLNTANPGVIPGKDARIFLGGSTATDRAYRLQRFNIRAAFPVLTVKELGNRTLVGKLADVPTVTVDFDVLAADHQPIQVLFDADSAEVYNLGSPKTLDAYIKVYDPALAEAASVLKSFKLENIRCTSGTPIRAQVRQLATMRYTATVVSATTLNSAGLIVYTGDLP